MPEERSKEYNNIMIEAYIDKPEKTLWYQKSFSKFNINGVDAMKWNWSWWAFGGGFLYLLYRKAYLASLLLFIASMTLGMIPFVGLAFMILSGGFSTYFVYKNFKNKLSQAEVSIDDETLRIQTMRELGGYNQWVVWIYAILMSIVFLGIFLAILIPLLAR